MRWIFLLTLCASTTSDAGETAPGPIGKAMPAPTPTPAPAPVPPVVTDQPQEVERAPFAVDGRIHLDALVGAGTLGVGLSGRAGKTFDNRFYVGGQLTLHPELGFYLGAEGGYELGVSVAPVTIRPYLGGGVAHVAMMTGPALWTGATAHFHVPSSRFVVGGDLRIVTGTWTTSFALFAVGGMYL